jgi:hypothetical protein
MQLDRALGYQLTLPRRRQFDSCRCIVRLRPVGRRVSGPAKRTQQNIGFVLTAAGFAGLLTQATAGELLDATRSKRCRDHSHFVLPEFSPGVDRPRAPSDPPPDSTSRRASSGTVSGVGESARVFGALDPVLGRGTRLVISGTLISPHC